MESAELGKGFDDPVLGAQGCFRAILAAMSEPGTIHSLPQSVEPPRDIAAASALVLLTLADQETSVWLAPETASMAPFVRFHCSARIATEPHAAAFALLDGRAAEPPLSSFEPGEERYPDKSATVIVQCASLEGGPAVTLTGPGIREQRAIAPAGLRPGFWAEMQANNARYPLGIDVIMTAGDRLLAVPRSTRIALPAEVR